MTDEEIDDATERIYDNRVDGCFLSFMLFMLLFCFAAMFLRPN